MDDRQTLREADDPAWPDEIARDRAAFYGIRTAALLANEARWIHRRVERFELIDERRILRHLSIDFTLPDLPRAPWESPGSRQWGVPVGLFQRRLFRAFDVRDDRSSALPVLTREQNAAIACALLLSQAQATLEDAFGLGTEVAPEVALDLTDIAGARRGPTEYPTVIEREQRTSDAVQRFRDAAIRAAQSAIEAVADPLQEQRQTLWRDDTMRGFMTILSERFILFVVIQGSPGDRRIVKVNYEQDLGDPTIFRLKLWKTKPCEIWRQVSAPGARTAMAERLKSTLGLKAHQIKLGTRSVFGPESYHVEIDAPAELVIEHAELERTTTITNRRTGDIDVKAACIAEDFCTERAHLYESLFTGEALTQATPPSANEEISGSSVIKVDLFIRPSFVTPAMIIGVVTTTMLLAGIILKLEHVRRSGDVTALIIVLPAIFAAYLIPGEHRLVRRMFRGLRAMVLVLAIISFGAAGSLTVAFGSRTMIIIWIVLLSIALVLLC